MSSRSFDEEYNEWEANRSAYRGIRPDEASQKWRAIAQNRGSTLNKSYDTLTEAQEAINTFRKEGKV